MSIEPRDVEIAQEDQPLEAHEIRITNHGKINTWVDFALEFFEANEEKALVFHTLPVAKDKSKQAEETSGATATENADKRDETPKQDGRSKDAKKLHASTSLIPRLVSVVEIIKREYLKQMDSKKAMQMSGLHQYNEIGVLEDETPQDGNDEDRAEAIRRALEGTNNVRIEKTAFMRVTLCRKEIPALAQQGHTASETNAEQIGSGTAEETAEEGGRRHDGC
ncbi:hypothetical protein EWM64_g984 [Hericium alpestre]|uniref:Uncharacterized protein n=1 Tax=Hericium alpestre TaxID=135208 RepID=A0A4Z0ABQ1_9AGAM|nr:hypothetical protein EWM64_g984 [Hericium alpestre]